MDFGSDGAAPVLDHASVPAVTSGPDGAVWLFFVDTDFGHLLEAAEAGRPLSTGVVGVGGLGAARSEDGRHFERVGLSFSGEGPLYMVDPDIQALPDGTWRMVFFGAPADQVCRDEMDPARSARPHAAYTAVSTDLVHWTHEGVAFTATAGGTDPTIWCEDPPQCALYLGGGAASGDGGRSFEAVEMRMPTPEITSPDVVATAAGWRMLYLERTQMKAAVSTDGRTWTDAGAVPVRGADPTLLRRGDAVVWLYVKAKGRPARALDDPSAGASRCSAAAGAARRRGPTARRAGGAGSRQWTG